MDFLCIDFINSEWYKTHKTFTDPLMDENWLKNFCLKWNLPITNILNKETIDSLLELRDFLSYITNNLYEKKTIASKDINKLNEYLKAFSFYKILKKDQNRFYSETVPLESNLNLIIFEIISSFVELITKYNIERIKLCENPACKWIFYDESRSHTRKWCDNTCATLIKVRRFRENKKHD